MARFASLFSRVTLLWSIYSKVEKILAANIRHRTLNRLGVTGVGVSPSQHPTQGYYLAVPSSRSSKPLTPD